MHLSVITKIYFLFWVKYFEDNRHKFLNLKSKINKKNERAYLMHSRMRDKVKHTTLLLDEMAATSGKIMVVY